MDDAAMDALGELQEQITQLQEDVKRLKQQQGHNQGRISIALTHLATVLRWAYANAKANGDRSYETKLLVAGKGIASCFTKTQ